MSIGDIGHWRDSAGGQFATANTWGGFNFASQQRNDNSTYSKPDDSTIEIEEAGDYLIIGHLVGTDGDTGRHNPQARLNLVTGTGNLFSMYHTGYNRNANNNDWSCFIFGIYRNGTVNDQVEIEWRRDTDAAGGPGGSTANASDIQIVRLGDNYNYGFYESTSAGNAFGGTAPNDIAFATTVHETDTAAIEIQANDTDIRIKGDNKRYLIAYGIAGDTGGSRTQRVSRSVTGSTEIDASRSYFFQRNGNNEYGGLGAVFLHETDTADEDISIQVWRGDGVLANEGGADVDGSWLNNSGAETACVVIELPDNVEVFASVDGTAAQDLSGGVTTTINDCRTVNFNDAASFTRVDNTQMDVTSASDAMVWGNFFTARSNVGSNTRLTLGARIEIDGVDQTLGVHKNYTRGNQGNTDTFGGAWHPGAIFAFTAGQNVEIETFDDGDNGAGDTTVANTVGRFAINLDTLEALGDINVNATGVQSASAIGTTTVTGDASSAISGISSAAAVGLLSVSVDKDALLTGVASSSGIGTVTVQGDASALVTGVLSASQVGLVTCIKSANVSLTGIEATSAVGILTATTAVNVTANLTGVLSASGIGIAVVIGEVNTSVTGIASSAGIGSASVVGDANPTVSGIQAISGVGALAVGVDEQVSISGVVSVSSVGALTTTTDIQISLNGIQSLSGIGLLTITGDAVVALNGIPATASLGNVTVQAGGNVSVGVAGISAIGQVGLITAEYDFQTSISGVQSIEGIGSLAVQGAAIANLTGLESISGIGVLTTITQGDAIGAISGVQAAAQVGALSSQGEAIVAISGISSTAQIGTVTAEAGDVLALLTGVQALGQPGTLQATGIGIVALTGIQAVSGAGSLAVVETQQFPFDITRQVLEAIYDQGHQDMPGYDIWRRHFRRDL